MFKQCFIYQITRPLDIDATELESKLKDYPFKSCSQQERKRNGWAAPVKQAPDMLVHEIMGFWIVSLRQQEKVIPPSAINERLEEKVAEIEAEHGRPVRRKEKAQLKEDITALLLPNALSRTNDTLAIIAPEKNMMFVNAGSSSKAEEVASSLRKALGSMPVVPLQTDMSPATVMSAWLNGKHDLPQHMTLGFEAVLKSDDEDGGSVRLTGMDVADEHALNYLNNGMSVTRLALNWKDKLDLVIDDQLILKRIKLSDTYSEEIHDELGESDAISQFTGSAALITTEILDVVASLNDNFSD
ncbi:recombination-associated protein RdgC [Litoribacillus peritrichatus]|uniref:Recombination-associated protein RdgC n=1 Tax=Litoribacillus peritrichatus TaxID=718191 RepID=A0ABP7NAP5_9GAMM